MKKYLNEKADHIRRRALRNSNPKIDLLRINAMFCVVFSHCFCYWPHFIRLIPNSSLYSVMTFIFCAGYFYQAEQDDLPVKTYIWQKIRAYVLPYFLWNLFYGVVCTVLRHLGIVTYGHDLNLKTMFYFPWTNAAQFLFNYAAWFLLSLFLVSVTTFLIRKALRKLPVREFLRDHLLLAAFLITAIAAVYLLGPNQSHMEWKIGVLRPLTMLPYFLLGYVYRRYWEHKGSPILWWLLSTAFVVLLHAADGMRFAAGVVYGTFVGMPVLLVLASVGMIISLCSFIELFVRFLQGNRLIKYCAQSTMYIMLHHLFVVFLMNFAFWRMYVHGWIPGFDVEKFHNSFWYRYQPFGTKTIIIYVAIGFLLPVLLHWVYEKAVLLLNRKVN